MQFIFNSLDELKQFYSEFEPRSGATALLEPSKAPSREQTSVEKNKKPLASKEEAPAKATADTSKNNGNGNGSGKRRGRPPAQEKQEKTEAAASKRSRREGPSLTDLIRGSIDSFIKAKKEFTANDIYDQLEKEHPEINKQSVITSVLKQMNSTYSELERGEKAGKGPRAVKVYYPKGVKAKG